MLSDCKKCENLKNDIAEKDYAIFDLMAERARLLETLKEYNDRLSKTDPVLTELRETMAEKNLRIANLEGVLDQKDNEIQALRHQIKISVDAFKEMEKKLDNLIDRKQTLLDKFG